MMQKSLGKYKIGLAVIGLFVLGILIMVLVQAGTTKQDNETYKQASKVADTLDKHVSTSNTIPDSLAEAGIKAASDSVTYTKLSDARYKFCVTYKADSSGFDGESLAGDLTATALTGGHYTDYEDSSDNRETSYLYLNSTHHKGKNCQTVKPYIYSDNYYDYNAGSSSSN